MGREARGIEAGRRARLRRRQVSCVQWLVRLRSREDYSRFGLRLELADRCFECGRNQVVFVPADLINQLPEDLAAQHGQSKLQGSKVGSAGTLTIFCWRKGLLWAHEL